MRHIAKSLITGLISGLAMAGFTTLAHGQDAQNYPNRAARIIVPFAPGGVADGSARLIAHHLSKVWDQSFIVQNRPGGASIIAFTAAIQAPADGYTLLFANTNIATNPSLYTDLTYDAERDLTPVAFGVATPGIIVAHPSFPADTIPELIALAKEKPGQYDFSSVGAGSFAHLAMEQLKQDAGIDISHIPYKGYAPALMAVLANEVQLLVSDTQGALPHIKEGKLKALAVTSKTRLSLLPDVPTVAESEASLADFEGIGWLGIMAPADTPRAIIDKLNAEINRGLASPENTEFFAQNGVLTIPGSPEDFGKFIQDNRKKWAKVIETAGIKPN